MIFFQRIAPTLLVAVALVGLPCLPTPSQANTLYRMRMQKGPAKPAKVQKPPEVHPELQRELEALEAERSTKVEQARQELMQQLNQAQHQFNQDLAQGMEQDRASALLEQKRQQLQRAYLEKRKALAKEYYSKAADARAKVR